MSTESNSSKKPVDQVGSTEPGDQTPSQPDESAPESESSPSLRPSDQQAPQAGRPEDEVNQADETAAQPAPAGGESNSGERNKRSSEKSEKDEVQPVESDEEAAEEPIEPQWYILKVQVNREASIRDALQRRVKMEGLERYFNEIIVPTEDVAEFTKTGKRRVVKRKLYPGYLMVNMAINDDTWFLVRETPGIGDFTGSAGKPTPMDRREVERILNLSREEDEGEQQIKTAIPFRPGDRVRVKDGNFQNFEGDVDTIDEANGRVTVMINIFGRSTPVEFEHWQIEGV